VLLGAPHNSTLGIMKTRAEYEKALAVIKSVVHDWDPYRLLETGAPEDEFDGEIAGLATYIPRMRSPMDAAAAVSSVFSSAFEPHLFTPQDCSEVGAKLYARLLAAGFLVDA
jgi:hypothetical protein